jgi:DNA-binding LytR/AlgR family response regulator
LRAANKAKAYFQLRDGQREIGETSPFLYVKSEYKLIKINLNEVLYFEGLKDYVKIHLETQDKPILTLMSLKALEEKLPTEQFMRVHRSYIVNLEKIELVERSRIVIGDFAVVIAEQYREKFQKYLSSKYLNS